MERESDPVHNILSMSRSMASRLVIASERKTGRGSHTATKTQRRKSVFPATRRGFVPMCEKKTLVHRQRRSRIRCYS